MKHAVLIAVIAGAIAWNVTPDTRAMPARQQGPTARAHFPYVSQGPSAAHCRNLVHNGGFEQDDGWDIDPFAGRNQLWFGFSAFAGRIFLVMSPRRSREIDVHSQVMELPDPDRLESAEGSFWLSGRTLESVNHSDSFAAFVWSVPNGEKDGLEVVDLQFNEKIVEQWTLHTHDLLPALKSRRWNRVLIEFEVENDSTAFSDWFVDEVKLTVCARP